MRNKEQRVGSWNRLQPQVLKPRFGVIDYAAFAAIIVVTIYGCVLLAKGELNTFRENHPSTITEPVK